MRRAAIVSPIRTGVGKFQGSLASMSAGDLGAVVLKALMERVGLRPGAVKLTSGPALVEGLA